MESLYAAGPDDFMATRKRLVAEAKSAGDAAAAAEIGRLRKPSVAAWAVNLVARNRQDTLEQLVDTGTRMRIAQSHLDTATLTSLRPDRDRLIADFTDAAVSEVAEAGRALSAAGQQEIRDTVIAALASEDATHAVVSGQLTRALSYSGFGEVDLSEAVARTSSGSILTVLPGAPRATAQAGGPTATRGPADAGSEVDRGEGGADGAGAAEQHDEEAARAQATDALAQAQARLAEAEAAVSSARERAEETRERLAVVERQLAKARAADERALEEVTEAVRLRKEAEAAVAAARGDPALGP
jgi:hypothetical protein